MFSERFGDNGNQTAMASSRMTHKEEEKIWKHNTVKSLMNMHRVDNQQQKIS
jgi:hypothetical protein